MICVKQFYPGGCKCNIVIGGGKKKTGSGPKKRMHNVFL